MQNDTTPKLYYRGQPLDTSSQAFGEMRASQDALGDFAELRRRIDEDGYLLLPGLLDRDRVMSARREILGRIDALGLLDADSPLIDGIIRSDMTIDFENERQFHGLAIDNPPLEKLLYSGAMMDFFAAFLEGPVRHYDRTWLRVKGNRDTTTTHPHYDIVYMGRGTPHVFTAWTALGDTPLEMGGLMIAERSHQLEEVKQTYGQMDVDTYCTNSEEAAEIESGKKLWSDLVDSGAYSQDAVAAQKQLDRRWLSSNYQAGDVIVFTMYTLHAGLDNQTNRLRLSTDSRYQLASEPIDERWIGKNPIGHGPKGKIGMIC
ncbi:phytanoyl-CoA dioxygenase family protein [Pirellulales bacterium]|nr:phytanoyl-CoA dioxygenase family protein [Pirellulales bacterium]